MYFLVVVYQSIPTNSVKMDFESKKTANRIKYENNQGPKTNKFGSRSYRCHGSGSPYHCGGNNRRGTQKVLDRHEKRRVRTQNKCALKKGDIEHPAEMSVRELDKRGGY